MLEHSSACKTKKEGRDDLYEYEVEIITKKSRCDAQEMEEINTVIGEWRVLETPNSIKILI